MKRLSQRELRRLQARMLSDLGIELNELGRAKEVVITLEDGKVIKVVGASVIAMETNQGKIYQLVGGEEEKVEQAEEEAASYEPAAEDVALVAMQAGVSEEQARRALIDSGGDLAKAILMLRGGR